MLCLVDVIVKRAKCTCYHIYLLSAVKCCKCYAYHSSLAEKQNIFGPTCDTSGVQFNVIDFSLPASFTIADLIIPLGETVVKLVILYQRK